MIENKTGFQLPEYVADSFREFCDKANIGEVRLVIKRRNRCVGDCWVKKGNRDLPSGMYRHTTKTIIIRMGRKTSKEDFRFVLAHEVGHCKQYSEAPRLITAGDFRRHIPKPETYASSFALLTCNCYPKSNYRLSRIK